MQSIGLFSLAEITHHLRPAAKDYIFLARRKIEMHHQVANQEVLQL